jgi:hypothetical protein
MAGCPSGLIDNVRKHMAGGPDLTTEITLFILHKMPFSIFRSGTALGDTLFSDGLS